MQRYDNLIEMNDEERRMLCGILKDYIKMTKIIIEFKGDLDSSLTRGIIKYREVVDILED